MFYTFGLLSFCRFEARFMKLGIRVTNQGTLISHGGTQSEHLFGPKYLFILWTSNEIIKNIREAFNKKNEIVW